MTCPRLIEVALPIREISAESVRDKSLRHGHISTLHLWWARRPLAASRAIVFASLVPDPDNSECPPEFRKAVNRWLKDEVPSMLKAYRRGREWVNDRDPYRPYDRIPDTLRNRLLTFIARWSPAYLRWEKDPSGKPPATKDMLDGRCLIKWETSDPENEQGKEVLRIARELIKIANGGEMPVLLDPFSGGGAIPLEASRLGCQPIANDYNPVAYLILRATCEFPQRYGKRLVDDVERWAKWILERARERIGHLYPPGEDGNSVVGYLWARTAPCSNPTCRAEIPLLRSLLICKKSNKRVALTMTTQDQEITFGIAKGKDITRTDGTMLNRGNCRCPICGQVTPVEDLRRAGLEGKMGERMVAVITDTPHGKDYRPVEPKDFEAFEEAKRLSETVERPSEYIVPEINAPNATSDAGAHRSISVDLYGFKMFGALFNPRQLLAMQTFVACLHDALAELKLQEIHEEYCQAVAVNLGLWVSRLSQRLNTVCFWDLGYEKINNAFGRQAIPMTWDFCEANIFSESTGSAIGQLGWILRAIKHESPLSNMSFHPTLVFCGDGAQLPLETTSADVVITDPPYFDSIAYADLSDFFYIWLKRGLSDVFPEAFVTPQTPKSEEAVAHKHRHHGNRQKGKEHFQRKLTECFVEANRICKLNGVLAVMFAHQSTEAWTALINALFEAGLNVTATYPIDTELTTALKRSVSALASSITVVCRPREVGAAASFREVRREIEKAVQESVQRFWEYGFRGADLIVATYGPAVGVFGRYERVERADGRPVEVPELLELARSSALKAIAGEFQGDTLSRLYFVWANLYGASEQAWDDARLVVQIGGESEDAMEVARRHGLFVVDGSRCRLALLNDRAERRNLGGEPDSPLIDRLHRAMLFWKEENRPELVSYLSQNELLDYEPFWKLAQALFEVLPRDGEGRKILSALLGERDIFQIEARRLETMEETLF